MYDGAVCCHRGTTGSPAKTDGIDLSILPGSKLTIFLHLGGTKQIATERRKTSKALSGIESGK
jgi:hypothetical protein